MNEAAIAKRLAELQAEFPRKVFPRGQKRGFRFYETVKYQAYSERPEWCSSHDFDRFTLWCERYVDFLRVIERFDDGFFVVELQEEPYTPPPCDKEERQEKAEARGKLFRETKAVAGKPMFEVGYQYDNGYKKWTHRFVCTAKGLEAVQAVLELPYTRHYDCEHKVRRYVDKYIPAEFRKEFVFVTDWVQFGEKPESFDSDKPRVIGWGWGRD